MIGGTCALGLLLMFMVGGGCWALANTADPPPWFISLGFIGILFLLVRLFVLQQALKGGENSDR